MEIKTNINLSLALMLFSQVLPSANADLLSDITASISYKKNFSSSDYNFDSKSEFQQVVSVPLPFSKNNSTSFVMGTEQDPWQYRFGGRFINSDSNLDSFMVYGVYYDRVTVEGTNNDATTRTFGNQFSFDLTRSSSKNSFSMFINYPEYIEETSFVLKGNEASLYTQHTMPGAKVTGTFFYPFSNSMQVEASGELIYQISHPNAPDGDSKEDYGELGLSVGFRAKQMYTESLVNIYTGVDIDKDWHVGVKGQVNLANGKNGPLNSKSRRMNRYPENMWFGRKGTLSEAAYLDGEEIAGIVDVSDYSQGAHVNGAASSFASHAVGAEGKISYGKIRNHHIERQIKNPGKTLYFVEGSTEIDFSRAGEGASEEFKNIALKEILGSDIADIEFEKLDEYGNWVQFEPKIDELESKTISNDFKLNHKGEELEFTNKGATRKVGFKFDNSSAKPKDTKLKFVGSPKVRQVRSIKSFSGATLQNGYYVRDMGTSEYPTFQLAKDAKLKNVEFSNRDDTLHVGTFLSMSDGSSLINADFKINELDVESTVVAMSKNTQIKNINIKVLVSKNDTTASGGQIAAVHVQEDAFNVLIKAVNKIKIGKAPGYT